MKVRELRKALEGVDDDMEVATPNSDANYTGHAFAIVEEASPDCVLFTETGDCYSGWPAECDAEEIENQYGKKPEDLEHIKVFLIN